MNKVSKEEFGNFIDGYPNELSVGTVTICEPPLRVYRDELIKTEAERGTADYYFDKKVASISMDYIGPNGDIDENFTGKYWEYFIEDK